MSVSVASRSGAGTSSTTHVVALATTAKYVRLKGQYQGVFNSDRFGDNLPLNAVLTITHYSKSNGHFRGTGVFRTTILGQDYSATATFTGHVSTTRRLFMTVTGDAGGLFSGSITGRVSSTGGSISHGIYSGTYTNAFTGQVYDDSGTFYAYKP